MDNQKNKTDHDHEFDGKKDRNFYQKPFDDVTDPLPQIDEKSAALAEKDNTTVSADDDAQQNAEDNEDDSEQENDSRETYQQQSSDRVNEINEEDVRDQSDSTRDWNAEHNRSSRQK